MDEKDGQAPTPIQFRYGASVFARTGAEVLVREAGSTTFRQFHLSVPTTFIAQELSPACIPARQLGLDRGKMAEALEPKAQAKKFLCCVPGCRTNGKVSSFQHRSGLCRHSKKEHPEATVEMRQQYKAQFEAELWAEMEEDEESEGD